MKNFFALLIRTIVIAFFLTTHFALIVSANMAVPSPEHSPQNASIADSLSKNSTQAIKHFRKGTEYFVNRKVDLAIQEYRKALEFDPNLSVAYLNLGMSYLLQEEFDNAAQELKKAIRKKSKLLDSELKKAHFNLWWAYRKQQKYDQGIEELKKIIDIDPNDVNVYINLGDTYLSDKKIISEAISSYLQGITKDQKNVPLHQKLGKAYELNQQWDEAIKHFEQAINLKTDDPYSYLFLYVALKKSGQNPKAKMTIQKALSAFQGDSGQNPSPASNSSQLRYILEYLEGAYAEKDLLSIQNQVILCQANYYIGMNYVFEKDFKKAAHYLQQAIDTNIFFISEYEYAKIELDRIKDKK